MMTCTLSEGLAPYGQIEGGFGVNVQGGVGRGSEPGGDLRWGMIRVQKALDGKCGYWDGGLYGAAGVDGLGGWLDRSRWEGKG
jgi:hypothetical protein